MQTMLFYVYYWYGFPIIDYEAYGAWEEEGVLCCICC